MEKQKETKQKPEEIKKEVLIEKTESKLKKSKTSKIIEQDTKDSSNPNQKEKIENIKIDEKEIEKDIKKANEEVKEATKDITKGKIEERISKDSFDIDSWNPQTGLGKQVKNKEIVDIDKILDQGLNILEPEIVDALIPNLEKDLLLIGQSKGKFGGGQRRVFKQTQKKTPEGNKPRFASYAVIGNKNGYVGTGYGKAKETVPSREKSFRNAKLNLIKIKRGCGSWQCNCKTPHSIPFEVEGKCSSVKIKLIPAPKGTGLCVESSCAKILELAGIQDVWSRSFGQTKSKINLIKACLKALRKLSTTKVKPHDVEALGIKEGLLE
ncbi:30S ribosomal protein S5 [Candidatus Woesearchaeota archaeon]|nr:30S ribosomal protein S5 [Candidatus Woesearchaeota archaeon]MBL7050590.1 30S ribosomal protein S5 [Candidatus Woesearchaeota archaeon]